MFPGCGIDARTCDLDHIQPYRPPGHPEGLVDPDDAVDADDSGPPGQTNPANLAPLCRRHHRAKTHRRWRYHRNPETGAYHWTSPSNATYTVTR